VGYRAVDVMGFAGGFTLGMVQAGFELVGKCELPGGFGVKNCEGNRALLGEKWEAHVGEPETAWPTLDADVVFGNPPCSGFSVMSAATFRGADSKINKCMWQFASYVSRVRPPIAVFESVQPAYRREDGRDLMCRLRAFVEDSTGLRYDLWHVLHNAYSIGGPAQRRRYFWLISRIPFGIEEPVLRYTPTLRDIIGDLESLGTTWYPQPYRTPPSGYARQFISSTGAVDGMMHLQNINTKRIQDLMCGVPWNAGEAIQVVVRRYYEKYGKLPKSWAPREQKIVRNDFNMGYTTPTRWDETKHARVVTGGALICVVHPYLQRTITHREAARILGFPDDWRIYPIRNVGGLNLTWGKGITVHCGRWIGEWIRRALDGCPGGDAGQQIGDRERLLDVTNSWKKFAI
jgi:DNA (cytosine-5)-methyltransferase 1